VATAGDDATARVWDARSGKELRQLRGHTDLVTTAAFAPDGRSLATGSNDRTVRVWDTETGEELALLWGHNDGVSAVAYGPEGQWLVSATGRPAMGTGSPSAKFAFEELLPAEIKVWDFKTRKTRLTLMEHTGSILSLAVSPDGKRLATAATDARAKVWDLQTGRLDWELTGFRGLVFAVVWGAVTPDGRYLAGRRPNSDVQLVDLESGKERWLARPHRADVWALSISPDGKTVATASWDGSAKLINAAGGQVMFTYRAPGVVWSSNFSPDGKWWAVGSGSAREGETVLFRAATPSEVLKTDSPAIVTQPSSQVATEGVRTSLRVVASGAALLLHQWQRDGQDLAGETNATLTLANLSTAQPGHYRVTLSNNLGTVTSSNAPLKVLKVREAPIAEASFEGDDPSLWCGSYASAEKPEGLATRAERMPGTGIRNSGGLVVTADATVLQAGSKQAWCGFAATIIARANRTTLVDTTDLALYKLYASARASGLTGSSARGSLQWQFRTADAALLTLSVPIVLTTNYQTYSYIPANAPASPACGGSWGEFVTRFDQIDRLQCAVAVDDWVGDYGTDADNALYVDDVRFVRLVPVTPAGSTEPTAGAPSSKKQAAR